MNTLPKRFCGICEEEIPLGKSAGMYSCDHTFHAECFDRHNIGLFEKNKALFCPQCYKPAESNASTFSDVVWQEMDDGGLIAWIPQTEENEKGTYWIGPYPWIGRIDFSHKMVATKTGRRGVHLWPEAAEEDKERVLALYRVQWGGRAGMTPNHSATGMPVWYKKPDSA